MNEVCISKLFVGVGVIILVGTAIYIFKKFVIVRNETFVLAHIE